ncbi:MAG: FGGY-family carbohydrate kinase, partial [Robiginitalea sp.]
FGEQGVVSVRGAAESGLLEGTPILYRAGDQPNNALSLNVFNPGEVAATGGTSGVVYAIRDSPEIHENTRVNHFAHVNYRKDQLQAIGTLLCINGAGIQYRWLLNNLAVGSYREMNQLASQVAVGSDGVRLLPFGNGAERMLDNRNLGAHILHLDLNRHSGAHLFRAALEGISFSFVYGIEIMMSDGLSASVIRAGNDNLFQSEIFARTLATLIDKKIEVYNTTGAVGAARACILRDGDYETFSAYTEHDLVQTYKPLQQKAPYKEAYDHWKNELELILQKQIP